MRASQFRLPGGVEFLKLGSDRVDQPIMSSENATDKAAQPKRSKSSRKKRRRRGRRLTDKIRAALARAAAMGRRDVTAQLGNLYQEAVEEELGHEWQRRTRDPGLLTRRFRRRH